MKRLSLVTIVTLLAMLVLVSGLVAFSVWWVSRKEPTPPEPPAVVCYEGVVGMEVPQLVGLYMLGPATICAENWHFSPQFTLKTEQAPSVITPNGYDLPY